MTLSLLFFFISLTGIFLSEVFAGYNRLELSHFLIFLSPLLLFLLARIEKKKIVIPLNETIIYLVFAIFSVISTIFSIDKEVAIRSLLIYLSGYLFFIFSFNYSKELNKYFKYFLILISIFSCLVFLANNIFHLDLFKKGISLFYNYGHYQIGNLLVLGVLSIFPNPFSLIFFGFILFSYSRTAHISLIVTFIILLFKEKLDKKTALLGALIIFASLIFIFLKSGYLHKTNKQLVSGRNIYFSYALSSIKEFPLFGTGPGNFIYSVFKRQVNLGEYTDQTDNIFLQVLSENGILAGIFFITFVLLILRRHKKNKNYLAFLALTLMFMSDLTYSFNFFLILWFILGGLTLDSKKKKEVNIIFPVLIIFLIAQIILLSQILLKQGLWKQSLLIYPFQKNAYKIAIYENIKNKNKKEVYYFLQKYDKIFGKSLTIFQETYYYQFLGKNDKAASLYEKSLWFRTFTNIQRLKNIWSFYRSTYGNLKGNEKMAQILVKIKKSYSEKDKNSDFYKLINDFCLKTDIGC
jgi:O-antigen ligase